MWPTGEAAPCGKTGDDVPRGTVSTGVLGSGICGGGDREDSLGGKGSCGDDKIGVVSFILDLLSALRELGDLGGLSVGSAVEGILGDRSAMAMTRRCTSSSCSPKLPVL